MPPGLVEGEDPLRGSNEPGPARLNCWCSCSTAGGRTPAARPAEHFPTHGCYFTPNLLGRGNARECRRWAVLLLVLPPGSAKLNEGVEHAHAIHREVFDKALDLLSHDKGAHAPVGPKTPTTVPRPTGLGFMRGILRAGSQLKGTGLLTPMGEYTRLLKQGSQPVSAAQSG
jgi:hypothetical protein